mmetsp:Transcript_58958/g.133484  ORF Transcript_58958/g.133484 Transcript_58958/m.133484 type:complete len:356 (+) Transcript_58958:85-1152(+)
MSRMFRAFAILLLIGLYDLEKTSAVTQHRPRATSIVSQNFLATAKLKLNPFELNHSSAFAHSDYVKVQLGQLAEPGDTAQRAFFSEVGSGRLAWNSAGVSFPRGFGAALEFVEETLIPDFLFVGSGARANASELMLCHDLYVKNDSRCVRGLSDQKSLRGTPKAGAAVDLDLQFADNKVDSLLAKLRRDGFILIDDWGIDADELSAEVEQRLAEQKPRNKRQATMQHKSYRGPLSTMSAVLKNETVRKLVLKYLGGDAILSGHTALRLKNGLSSTQDYVSGLWHHDRCGRRLKAFVFLHDISAKGGRVTKVAKGSHETFFWGYHDAKESRFDERWVIENYKVVAMEGKKRRRVHF